VCLKVNNVALGGAGRRGLLPSGNVTLHHYRYNRFLDFTSLAA
jgi:hypothetical protein